jgi:hypothetical protein
VAAVAAGEDDVAPQGHARDFRANLDANLVSAALPPSTGLPAEMPTGGRRSVRKPSFSQAQ